MKTAFALIVYFLALCLFALEHRYELFLCCWPDYEETLEARR